MQPIEVNLDGLRARKKVGKLSASAIAASLNVSKTKASAISADLHSRDNCSRAIVACFDIRKSTKYLAHLEDFKHYARLMSSFVTVLRHVVNESGGWFDKFTGDGALVYWLPELGDDLTPEFAERALFAVANILAIFHTTFFPELKKIGGIIPEGFGLAAGMDFGRCILSDFLPERSVKVDGARVEIETTQGTVTVLGRVIVGAVRITSAARAGEVVLNASLGACLEQQKDSYAHHGIKIEREVIPSKDIEDHQHVYRCFFSQALSHSRQGE